MWNVQLGASRLPPCSAPLRTWLTGAQLWSRTCVFRLHVFCARACVSEPLAPERARCLSWNLMGRQQRRRCKDEPTWFYFCPCRDSAVLHSALLGFRTTDYLQEMQGNMLWTRDDWRCLSPRSFPCIVILRKQNSKEKKKGEEKQGVKYDPVLRDPCCVEQTGHRCIRPGTILHENIFSRKNNDRLLIAWKSITNVNNKQVLFCLAVLLIVPIHRCWVLRGLCVWAVVTVGALMLMTFLYWHGQWEAVMSGTFWLLLMCEDHKLSFPCYYFCWKFSALWY